MNTQPDTGVESPLNSQVIAPAAISATRRMYWSVRRELWENRSIYIGPLIAAAVMIAAFLITLIGLPRSMRALAGMNPDHQRGELVMPYGHAAILLVAVAFLVGVFYCIDALHGERRDRSILFWKSLPVSDLTTVLSKASIPLVVLPLLVFVIVVALQFIMLLLSSAVLLLTGVGVATLWAQVPLFQMELGLLYGLVVLALWHAPLYAWVLLVSAWARRATFLWVVLPPLAIGIFETIAFHTSYLSSLLKYRLVGCFTQAFGRTPGGGPVDPHFIPLTQLTPGRFLSSPGLWVGLAFAAAFFAAAVRLRHYREPI